MNSIHENSHKVKIFRTGSFLSRAQTAETQAYFAQSKESIGSYFEKNSIKVANGLSFEEEKILMPSMIDREPEDREFKAKVTEFFSDITTNVPYNTGLELEIGLTVDNAKPISDKNRPIVLMDYLRYRHAIGHPQVAMTKEKATGNMLKHFYIFDASDIQASNTKSNNERDGAMSLFLTIKSNMGQVDQMLALLGVDIRSFNDVKDKDNLKIEELRRLSVERAKDFIRINGEGEFEIKSWIINMAKTGVLKQIGEKYMDGETMELVGNSMDEMVAFFKDESQSGAIVTYKARLQEAMLKPMPKQVKKTIA